MRLPALASALLVTASTASAQLPDFAATGSDVAGGRDNRWQVACTVLSYPGAPAPSAVGSTACDGSFTAAYAVTGGLPAGWGPVPAGASWISVQPNATLDRIDDPSAPGYDFENPLYEYTFRYAFDVGPSVAPGKLTLGLGLLRLDNYWVGYRLNGGAVTPVGITPEPAAANGANWMTEFALDGVGTGGTKFVAGANTFDLVVRGNGYNDGILATGAFAGGELSTVPEPSTYALVAVGVAGMAAAARRRRRTA